MKLRNLVLAGILAVAGVGLTAQKADAQVYFGLRVGNPYGYGYGNPYFTGFGNPYVGTYSSFYTPYATGFSNPYWGGYAAPYYSYRDYVYSSPFVGSSYYGYRYMSPSIYGPGGYQYRYWQWR
jgi:hypothetical protein